MLKRILNITQRDFKSNVREFILLYILVAPIILAVGLNVFIPSIESSSVQFAVDESVEKAFVEHLSNYGSVEAFDSIEALKNRLTSIDEVIGFVRNNGAYEVILYGDERPGAAGLGTKIISQFENGDGAKVFRFTSLGESESPVALIGTVSLIAMALALGGGIIGLNIIEEKEEKTIRAIVVSPVNRFEFIVGKSLTGAVTALIQTFGILFIVGYGHVNMMQIFFFTVISLSILVLFGFLIGVLSTNQVMGLANLKFLFLPISISVIGAVIIPKAWQFTLYWSPFYWSYLGYAEILQDTATWSSIGVYSLWIIGLFSLVLYSTRKKIIKGLS